MVETISPGGGEWLDFFLPRSEILVGRLYDENSYCNDDKTTFDDDLFFFLSGSRKLLVLQCCVEKNKILSVYKFPPPQPR